MLGVLAALLGGAALWWLNHDLQPGAQALELAVDPGTPPRGVAQAVQEAGAKVNPLLLYGWFRLSGQSRQIRAGNYEIEPGSTPRSLLRTVVRGEESLRSVTLVEGWTLRQVRAALQKEEQLRPDTQGLTPEKIMEALGLPGVPAEGRFYPDTYSYARGSSDLALLRRALHAMDRKLDAAWQRRAPDSPLRTPQELLVLASIIEKETGRASDRPMISGVFVNRLRLGMPLQTDPTVIYGLGEAFDGNLRKRDLLADTPWNTYTRRGLPPTPIAMPGWGSLQAAVQPASTQALYFVARGDGSSAFSASLQEHNRAVNQYQRKQ
ncbi:MAG: endolytic transglycosylase MltG [Pseudomonadota bacterium]